LVLLLVGFRAAVAAAGWGRSAAGEEFGQRGCEVFGGYPVPGAGQEARGSVWEGVGYSPGPVAQLVTAALAGDHEGGVLIAASRSDGIEPGMKVS